MVWECSVKFLTFCQGKSLAIFRDSCWTRLSRLSSSGGDMRSVNIHEAKTHLSRLVEEAANGEPFVIAKAGKKMVKVVAIDDPAPKAKRRLGFMKGMYSLPDNFEEVSEKLDKEIEKMFYGEDEG